MPGPGGRSARCQQFQSRPDQRRRIRLSQIARHRCHRLRRIALPVAQVHQRRQGIGRSRGPPRGTIVHPGRFAHRPPAQPPRSPHPRPLPSRSTRAHRHHPRRLGLQLQDHPLRQLRPHARRRLPPLRASPSVIARPTPSAPSVPRIAIAALAPTPCTVISSLMPFLFQHGGKAEQLQKILAHQQVGIKRDRLPTGGSAAITRSLTWTI
jgi:hypothetical protein